MTNNPVYVFFATPASWGPLLLRLMLAVMFFFHGAQNTVGWFGGRGWQGAVETLTAQGAIAWPILIGVTIVMEIILALALFLGLFTRLAALGVMALTIFALTQMPNTSAFEALELPLLTLAAGLSLISSGGGRLSVDRKIGDNLIPYIG